MMIGPNNVQYLGQVSSLKKDNPGISSGLSVKNWVLWHFLGKDITFEIEMLDMQNLLKNWKNRAPEAQKF